VLRAPDGVVAVRDGDRIAGQLDAEAIRAAAR
jgi:septum formation inhibitor-activating ATPase MinD